MTSSLSPSPSDHFGNVKADHKIAMGFDGFVDQIVRIVKERKSGTKVSYMTKIRELGDYIVAKSEGNFAFEIDPVTTKLGGNMPIMAHALACLGYRPHCVGTLGYPRVHPVFEEMKQSSELYSFADPGITTALEFNNGKILLGEMRSLNEVRWQDLIDRIGVDVVKDIFSGTHLVSLVNWSELEHATELWKGVLEVMKNNHGRSDPLIFFDLADCSRKGTDEIREAIEVIAEFKRVGTVALSLNRNETNVVLSAIDPDHAKTNSFERKGKTLFQSVRPDYLVLRQAGESILFHDDKAEHMKYTPLPTPLITTGAGDHFNAGFCAAWLAGGTPVTLLETAHAVALHYMSSGRSPSRQEIKTRTI